MDNYFLLEVVTPYGLVVSSKVEEAYIPGSQGDFGVLPAISLSSLLSASESYIIAGIRKSIFSPLIMALPK